MTGADEAALTLRCCPLNPPSTAIAAQEQPRNVKFAVGSVFDFHIKNLPFGFTALRPGMTISLRLLFHNKEEVTARLITPKLP